MENWKIIKTKGDYDTAMARIIELATAGLKAETDEMDEFELLTLLVGHYEKANFQMDKPDPIEAIKFRMDQEGLTPADMKEFIGSASKVSEVLNRKRPLSLSMIRRIHNGLGIPADILIKDVNELEWTQLDSSDELLELIGVSVSSHVDLVTGFSNKPDFIAHGRITQHAEVVTPLFSSLNKKEPKVIKDTFSFDRVAKIFGGVTGAKVHSTDTRYLDESFNLIS
ncbi:transcriptional regulator [Citrobacter freundii]|uniref:helix-turn-helix domain-containing protein n=1 Tax=Citrobacter TaxID=544 RepID=UPI00180C93E5|nr:MULTISPECIES: transcriptional regulator [Citrobacter]MBA8562193.1 transcriptional regulator [Citrobacter freundii]MDM2855141.1 transcriptional regulator [Citrobacter sp. Cpo065]WFU93236.1 transcriptional regulator [Citrobacter freundii]